MFAARKLIQMVAFVAGVVVFVFTIGHAPNPVARVRVRTRLRSRSWLSADEWYETQWKDRGISRRVADFAYRHLPLYSGLDFGFVRAQDLLVGELRLGAVCWGDWELDLYNDWQSEFGCSIVEAFDYTDNSTLSDLLILMTRCADSEPNGTEDPQRPGTLGRKRA
jgi:hypothetical protein